MAKQGMARPDWTHPKPHNTVPPVPEIQGKEKTSNSVDEDFDEDFQDSSYDDSDLPVGNGGPGLPSL
jgi:hypothetical protein